MLADSTYSLQKFHTQSHNTLLMAVYGHEKDKKRHEMNEISYFKPANGGPSLALFNNSIECVAMVTSITTGNG